MHNVWLLKKESGESCSTLYICWVNSLECLKWSRGSYPKIEYNTNYLALFNNDVTLFFRSYKSYHIDLHVCHILTRGMFWSVTLVVVEGLGTWRCMGITSEYSIQFHFDIDVKWVERDINHWSYRWFPWVSKGDIVAIVH